MRGNLEIVWYFYIIVQPDNNDTEKLLFFENILFNYKNVSLKNSFYFCSQVAYGLIFQLLQAPL